MGRKTQIDCDAVGRAKVAEKWPNALGGGEQIWGAKKGKLAKQKRKEERKWPLRGIKHFV